MYAYAGRDDYVNSSSTTGAAAFGCLCMHYCDCVSLIIGVGHSAADHGFGQGVYACACMYACIQRYIYVYVYIHIHTYT